MRNGTISLMAQQETASSPLAQALARVGDRWTLLVVEALLAGPQRFNDLLDQLPGIAANILSERLKRLEREGLLVARPYSDRPPRAAYQLPPRAANSRGRSGCWRTGGPGTPTRLRPRCTRPAEPRSRPDGTARPAITSSTTSRSSPTSASSRERAARRLGCRV